MMLTGVHPLYEKGDTRDSYSAKLKNIEWKFPNGFSKLGKDLFLNLMKLNSFERYNANEALTHPWITRIPKAPSDYQSTPAIACRNKLLKVFY